MNIVKLTNKIALITVILLIYWVFAFICTNVFGFKVFRENITEIFMMSVLGIFSVLSGAIILNVMLNLTAIANAREGKEKKVPKNKKLPLFIFLGLFLLIFLFLYAGDYATSKKREKYLVSSASSLIQEQKEIINRLADYSFSRQYIENSSRDIKLLSKIEEKFPRVTVITRDQFDGKYLLLGFGSYTRLSKDEKVLKVDYILSTSSEERKYLNSVFDGEVSKHRFSSHDGRYEIYYPVKTNKGKIILHLSQHRRYGKIGS